MGCALFANALARLRRSGKLMITGFTFAIISVAMAGYLDVALLAIVLPVMSAKTVFGFTVIAKLVWMTLIFFLIVRLLKPERWQFFATLAPVVIGSAVFCFGQFASHWRQWDLPLSGGVIARQVMALPEHLPQMTSQNAWLLFDTAPDDHFQVKINGEVVKNSEQTLVKWQAEGQKYDRIWRGLPLQYSYLQPNTKLIVEVQSIGKSTTKTKLYGDFPPADPAIFYGPAIDYRGEYRSIWRSRWSPIIEPRISKTFDLRGVSYQSELILSNGQALTEDLSPNFGRQPGCFRIYLGFFGPDDAPSTVHKIESGASHSDEAVDFNL
jgi:hypothetical protein